MIEAVFRYGNREKARELLNAAEDLQGTAPYQAVQYWLEQGEGVPGYKAYLKAFGEPRNGFVLQEMIEDGMPIDSIFDVEEKETPSASKTMLRTTVNALMTGKPAKKPNLWSDAVTQAAFVKEAEQRGLLSKQNKKRYKKYKLWKKMKKQKAEDIFNAYAKTFVDLKQI